MVASLGYPFETLSKLLLFLVNIKLNQVALLETSAESNVMTT